MWLGSISYEIGFFGYDILIVMFVLFGVGVGNFGRLRISVRDWSSEVYCKLIDAGVLGVIYIYGYFGNLFIDIRGRGFDWFRVIVSEVDGIKVVILLVSMLWFLVEVLDAVFVLLVV